MPQISVEALIVSIQAVAVELRALKEAADSGELEPEEYLLLEERERAAENLESAYATLALTVLNLPPYEQLIRNVRADEA